MKSAPKYSLSMAFISIVLPLAVSIPGICGDVQDDLTITNENITTDTTRTANKSISAGPEVTVGENATVYFHVINNDGSITLKPNFTAAEGSTFRAYMAKTPATLPQSTGTCPDFTEGVITVSPAGNSQSRNVKIWVSDAANTLDGPIVFYWHGTGGSPDEALTGLGTDTIDAIKAAGGIVAAPYHDPAAGTYPWFLTIYPLETREDDLRVADEILACALEEIGIDTGRIHSIGMSAGGLQTSQFSFRRSNYIASVVTYSGGIWACNFPPPNQDPSNKFAAMIFHGGVSDIVVISFKAASECYKNLLTANGSFAFICDHSQGHTMPSGVQNNVWQFFQDNRYGFDPSTYETGLPADFPSYCGLN